MSTRAPNPVLMAAGAALQFALNRALALDPELPTQMQALEGRRIELELTAPQLRARIEVEHGALKVGPALDGEEPDLSLKSTLGGLLSRVLPGAGAATPGRLRIAGDVELARQLQVLAQRYSPDLEAALSARLGDVLGVQLARALRMAFESLRSAGLEVAETSAEYLREERRDLLGADELRSFCEDVDRLRDDVERSERRIQRLRSKLS
jgi:ubiquinone biosynthesis accessory factor UbiJ